MQTIRVFLALCLLANTATAAEKASSGAEWPQWRGPERNGISTETGLRKSWENGEQPKLLWTVKGLGSGYSSVAIADGKIFTMGKIGNREHLIARSLSSGEEIWKTPVGNGDHSNCTPTVDGDHVYAVGLRGDLVCAKIATGAVVWSKNFEKDFGGKMMSGWGFSESPLIDGDRLICTPGAKDAVLAALQKNTGKVIWKAAMPPNVGNQGGDGAAYSSIVISNGAKTKQYIQLVGRGIVGVRAKDGKTLWTYNRIANGTANIPTPIVNGDYVFCSTGYGTGAALLKLQRKGSNIEAKELYYLKSDKMQNHHGGMILLDDHIYCGHGHNNGFPLCIEMKTGKVKWKPGRGAGTGSAAIALADGHFYFRYEDGTMALIEATPDEYRLKGSFSIASRNGPSWPHPVICDKRLYLRDQDLLHCYDLAAK